MTRDSRLGRWITSLPPLVYLLVFFAAPAAIMLFASFRHPGDYGGLAPWFSRGPEGLQLDLTLDNYRRLVESPVYLRLFAKSLSYAVLSTGICLLLAYPLALVIARSAKKWRDLLVLLVILPFWSNFLVRIYAWMILLSPGGALTAALNYYRANMPPAAWLRPPPQLPDITVPTMLVWGEGDQYLGLGLLERSITKVVGTLRVERLPGVSHWVQNEAPQDVNRLLLDWLGSART